MDRAPQIAQPTLSATPVAAASAARRSFIPVAVGVFVVCLLLGLGILVWPQLRDRFGQKQAVSPEQSLGQFLITGVSNSGSLTLQDLPVFTDVRSMFERKGKYLIVGYNRLAEYDPATKNFTRQNDRTRLTISSAAVVGDYIYVTGDVPSPQSEFQNGYKRTLLKVDLDSGVIVKDYFTADERSFVNLSAVGIGKDVWLSSSDGVMRLNTVTDQIVTYTPEKVGASSPDCIAGIREDGGAPTVLLNCQELALSTYQPKGDAWEVQNNVDSTLYTRDFYADPAQYGITLPKFAFISPMIGDHAYAFSPDALWRVVPGSFPTRIVGIQLPDLGENLVQALVGVSADERILVVARVSGEMQRAVHIETINPQTGEVKELLQPLNSEDQAEPNAEWREQLATIIEQNRATFREENGALVLTDEDGDALLRVDLATQELIIN